MSTNTVAASGAARGLGTGRWRLDPAQSAARRAATGVSDAGCERDLATLVGRRRAVGRDVLDGLGEEGVEGFPLRACQCGEDLVVDLAKRAIEVREQLLAPLGERDDRAATVSSVASALDQAGVLESVQDRDEIGGIDPE